jgi:hypothetical protein
MRNRNTLTNVLVVMGATAAIAIIIAGWHARRVQAIQDSEDRPNPFGFLELTVGQTARLNVVNLQPPPERDSPPPERDSPPPDPERVRLVFDVYVEDPDFTPNCGGIVPVPPTCLVRYRFLRRELREVELMPGQAASLNFTAAEGARVQAFIQALGGPDTVGNPNELGGPDTTPEPHLVPSLELREGTRTLFVVPAVAKFFNPQPDPPGLQQ